MTVLIQSNNTYLRSGPGKIGPRIHWPANHQDVNAISSLREWWNAPSGFGSLNGVISWVGRKSLIALTPDSSSAPSRASSAIGGKPAIQFGLLTRRVTDINGNALIPLTGDYTIAGVAKADPANTGNWNVFGNAAASGATDLLTRRTDDKISISRAGSILGVTTAFTSGSAFYWVLSWEQAITRMILRVNSVQMLSVVSGLAVQNSQLIVGAAQALPGSGGGGTGATPKGDYVADLLVFNKPLAAAAYADDLLTLESSFVTDYGAVFA